VPVASQQAAEEVIGGDRRARKHGRQVVEERHGQVMDQRLRQHGGPAAGAPSRDHRLPRLVAAERALLDRGRQEQSSGVAAAASAVLATAK
jgi:hypothetical protein